MKDELTGAWMHQHNHEEHLLQFIGSYHTHTVYSKEGKKFIESRGGYYTIRGGEISVTIEFDTSTKDQIGQYVVYHFLVDGNGLTIDVDGKKMTYEKIDNGIAPLGAVWEITSQLREGKLVPIHRTGTRKTLKILSATRFQWVAIDPGTKEFFGTGGGTYQFENGKYTEQIEFFSKDSNRIGTKISFDGRLENGEWHHSGTSTKGDTIYEIWSRMNH